MFCPAKLFCGLFLRACWSIHNAAMHFFFDNWCRTSIFPLHFFCNCMHKPGQRNLLQQCFLPFAQAWPPAMNAIPHEFDCELESCIALSKVAKARCSGKQIRWQAGTRRARTLDGMGRQEEKRYNMDQHGTGMGCCMRLF